METVITISGAEKAGSLARLVVFFTHQGYAVKGQRFAELPSGARLLKIRLGAAKVDKARLSAALRELDPGYRLLSVASEEDGGAVRSQTPAQSVAALIRDMASQFPDIADLVRAYGSGFSPETRTQALFDAGKKLGSFCFGQDGSGVPLKMPAALRRGLVPALEKFGPVEATDTQVALPASPFCGAGVELDCCHFITGFMQGFLDANPRGLYTKVQQATCRSRGHAYCTYTVAYEADR